MNKPTWSKGQDFPDTEPQSTLPMVPPGEESAYAETQPMPLANVRPARPEPLALAPIEVSVYEVMALARKDNRVCPQPSRWLEFFALLKEHARGAALPAEPLLGSAWASTPPLAKRMCFQEQIEWAARHGCLQAAYDVLKSLREGDWYAA